LFIFERKTQEKYGFYAGISELAGIVKRKPKQTEK
jgi:hypothetical protein